MRTLFLALSLALSASVMAGQSPCGTFYGKRICVTAEEYGDRWPVKIPFGIISCERPSDIVFTHGQERYGVNGLAMSNPKYRPYKEIARPHPTNVGWTMGSADFIRRGLSLCP